MEQSLEGDLEAQRPSGRLGRKFAFALLPLILLPLLILGGVAYLRMHAILRQESVDDMISAIEGQSTTLDEWATAREQYLFIGTQRETIRQHASSLLLNADDQEVISNAKDDLEALRYYGGGTFFGEILLVQISDKLVLSSTDPEHDGETVSFLPDQKLLDTHTLMIYDDQVLSPNNLGIVSISPLQISGTQPDLYLVGINTGSNVVQLMEELQVFWQRRGVYRIEVGKTFLALMPDKIFELTRYSTTMDAQEDADHPIFQVPISLDAGTLEYEDASGQSVLGAYKWIPDWEMAVVVELPTSEIFSGLFELAPFMVILILVTAIITLGVVFLVTNRMLQPLTSLADFANRISHGEWLYRVPEGRKDELGALAVSLNHMAEELGALYRSLETRVEARTRQVRTASEVARAIISIPNLDELLRQAVHLIKDRFGYDHVSIFLLDAEGQNAVLRESAGEIGATPPARDHQVQVGSQTLIGWVTANWEPKIVTDTSEDPVYLKNELMEGARSEVAIPLRVGGNPLGVIDVQSIEEDAFQQEALEVLQTLADLLSSAIENTRLAQESANAAERARLVSEITGQLSGILEPEQVLQSAAHALHRALGEADIVVKLVSPDEIPSPTEEGHTE